uniref:Ochratoxin A non-ribosomal peptide synthetase n=1 Tax=Penicillium nordicum TaxID=229535 RepID=Q5GH24_9EURO|nr:ochratoxin A non-ribosomal peptide synthetase [Penicillium nordicum]
MGFALLIMAVFHGIPCVILPDKPLSADLVSSVLSSTQPTAALFPPSILEDLSANSESMHAISKLKRVYFGGGPLSPEVGRKVSECTQLVSFLGMTEGGFVLSLLPQNGDWSYFEWSPTFGIEMEHVENGLREMVLCRHEKPELQPVFHTFPDLECYHTKDLYSPHPTIPNLWKFHGRLDDVIVLNNGEKFNPVTMEKVIEGHPLVARAVVVGLGRFQTALLIEPSWNKWDAVPPGNNLIDIVWPKVQEANRISPAHGHVMKNKIALASKDKPFAMTPKGSTQRRLVTDSYKDEVEKLYTLPGVEEIPFTLPPSPEFPNIVEFARNLVFYVSDIISCADDANLYDVGLDSLRTIQLASALRATGFQDITPQMIYMHPSIEEIAILLQGILCGTQKQTISRREKIDRLVTKYTTDLPQQNYVHNVCGTDILTVALTGSTGSLGSYLLDSLRSDKTVGKVYCLTRDGKEERQRKAFQERGLDPTIPDKVEFVQTSLGEHQLGIDDATYQEMLRSVDTVIHNAWRMDFNISVDSFEHVHIRAMRNLIEFSIKSAHRAHIHFLSSIGAIGGWTILNGPVIPELPFEDCDVALRQGYGEAKHICERICLAATQTAGVPTSIHRLGQIAGPRTESGFWNVQEWLPAIVATSKFLGKIPSTLGEFQVDWVPVVRDNMRSHNIHANQGPAFLYRTCFLRLLWKSFTPAKRHSEKVVSRFFT